MGVSKRFGGLVALDDVKMVVEQGSIHSIIGPNGAGKSTLLNCASGNNPPDEGSVLVDGADLTGKPPHVFAAAGLQRTYQHTRPFGGMTLTENVMVGAHSWTTTGWFRGAFRFPSARREEAELRELAAELLELVGLGDRGGERIENLTLVEERLLEIARCLAARPKILLLDEPAAGMGEVDANELGDLIRLIRDRDDLTVVLVEHHLEMALNLADRVTVIDFGKVIADDVPSLVRKDPSVIAAYIGDAS